MKIKKTEFLDLKLKHLSLLAGLIVFAALAPSMTRAAITPRPALNLGLVGYWSMDEGAGAKVGDMSGRGNNGDITGATWTDGKRGKALNFNGTSYRVNLGNKTDFAFSNALTFSAWVKLSTTQASSQRPILYKWASGAEDKQLSYYNEKFAFYLHNTFGGSLLTTNGTYNTVGQWYHVVATYDNSNATIYVNGAYENSKAATGDIADSTGNFYIGFNPDRTPTTLDSINGSIDEVRIYNRALSATEVASLYSSGSAKFLMPDNKGLVGYWSMDEGAGTKAGDMSGRGNNGDITGATWTEGKRGKALDFNGSSDYVNVAQVSELPIYSGGVYSVAMWVKGPMNQIDKRIFSEGNSSNTNPLLNIGTDLTNTGKISLFIRNDSAATQLSHINSTGVVFDDTWHHVVWTDNNGTAKLYIDGNQDATNFNYARSTLTLNRTSIGSILRDSPDYFFNGSIDEVRIYNQALSATEVAALYASSGKRAEINSSQITRLTNGLVGMWSLDGPDVNMATNTAYDRSGSNNNGTITGATQTIGKAGQALSFNGSDNYVDGPHITQLESGDMTFSLWAKPISVSSSVWLVQQWDSSQGPAFFTEAGGVLTFEIGQYANRLSTPSGTFLAGQWQHLVAVAQGTTLTIYVNGNQVAQGTKTRTENTSAGHLTIAGPSGDGGVNSFPGQLDEVRVYDRALSAAEVQQLYNMSVPAFRCGDPLIDTRDGKGYATVLVGTQCWMKQGLNIGTRVNGGTAQGTTCTSASDIEKYCYSDTSANCDSNLNPAYPDGGLYQWNQMMCGSTTEGVRGICPVGWHLPTDTEYCALTQAADPTINCSQSGFRGSSGAKLKPGGSTGWEGNLAGYYYGGFASRGQYKFVWASTEFSSPNAWEYGLGSAETGIYRQNGDKAYAFPVRCVKD